MSTKQSIFTWTDQIKFGPTRRDKCHAMNTWIYNKCVEYKKANGVLDAKLLKGWLIEAKKNVLPEYTGKELFKSPLKWLPDVFKKYYNITGYPSDLQLGSLTD